jgi:hypothetical protein
VGQCDEEINTTAAYESSDLSVSQEMQHELGKKENGKREIQHLNGYEDGSGDGDEDVGDTGRERVEEGDVDGEVVDGDGNGDGDGDEIDEDEDENDGDANSPSEGKEGYLVGGEEVFQVSKKLFNIRFAVLQFPL